MLRSEVDSAGRAATHRPQTLGSLLRQHRLEAGLTQDALAERAQLSTRGIADLERGARRFPYAETLRRLATALDLSAAQSEALELSAHRPNARAPKRYPRREQDGTDQATTGPQPLHNLPAHLPTLIGRDEALATLRQRLMEAETGLLTLTGPGGSGKTRLALALADSLVGQFADGVWLVELAPLADAGRLPDVVLASLGLHQESENDVRETLRDALSKRTILLVLDNCEHLVSGCAELAHDLLRACPGLRILATSREPLRLVGERTWQVPTLAVPNSSGAEDLRSYAAVQLFIERAQEVALTFELTSGNSAAVARICSRLDGLPLAIELAAAHVRVLSPEQILQRLDDAFRLLTSNVRGLSARQQTLRGTLDWSIRLLTMDERHLFERLSAFRGGWTLEGAEALCCEPAGGGLDVLEALTGLIDKCLIQIQIHAQTEHERQSPIVEPVQKTTTLFPDAGPRYRMLETIHQYAREQLEASGRRDSISQLHSEYYMVLAENAARELRGGAAQTAWLERLEQELDNLRAALHWSIDNDRAETALRIGGALGWFWVRRGYVSEAEQWLEQMLSRFRNASTSSLASALEASATVAWARWEAERALTRAQEALTLYRSLGDQVGIARALSMIGIVEHNRDAPQAAITAFEEALQVQSQLKDESGVAYSLLHLGYVTIDLQDYPRAAALLQEALVKFRSFSDEQGILLALIGLADAEIPRHHYAAADALLRESLHLCERAGDKLRTVDCLEGMAFLAASRGQGARAAYLLGAAARLREEIAAIPSVTGTAYRDRVAELARAAIGDSAFAQHFASGRRTSTADAARTALDPDQLTTPARTDRQDPSGKLTSREQRVVRLVAQGMTNREIAEELVVTERTAEAHVSNALGKLGLKSRTQLAVKIARSQVEFNASD